MAYTAPSTWVAGNVLTAAQLNQQIRDNLLAAFPLGVDAWTGWTPTLVQGVTVSKTVNRATYQRIGRLIIAMFNLTCSSAGTASNRIDIGLPVTAAYSADNIVGSGSIFDVTAGFVYAGPITMISTTTIGLYLGTGAVSNRMGATGGGFVAALASPDTISGTVMYEAAA